MNTKEIENIDAFSGHEGTQIRQIFSPEDTDNTTRYSLAHCTISPGNSSKPHKNLPVSGTSPALNSCRRLYF